MSPSAANFWTRGRKLKVTGVVIVALGGSVGSYYGWGHGSPGGNVPPAGSANVFVGQSAAGSGNGSSCANEKAATFFNDATQWGAGKTIAPGQTVGLCGTITSTLTAQASGTAGNPIVIRFQAGAMLAQPVCNPCLALDSRSYITIDGGTNGIVESTANGTSLANQSTANGISAHPCDNCEIENLEIKNMYAVTGAQDTDSAVDNSGERCIYFSGSNWLIHNNTLHDASWCLYDDTGASDTNVKIYSNNIYNVDHGWSLTGSESGGGNFWFHDNHVHDMAKWDACAGCHHDGVHCYSASPTGLTIGNLYFYNNLFDGDPGAKSTSWIFLEANVNACATGTDHVYVFNNKAANTTNSTSNDEIYAGQGTIFFANNTIAATDSTNVTYTCFQVSGVAGSVYENNAVGGCNQLVHGANNGATFDYNAYANCTGSFNCFWVASTDTDSFATYQGAGYEPHSIANLSSSTGSNVTGAGTNLTASCTGNLAPLCTTRLGVARPTGVTAWNAGSD